MAVTNNAYGTIFAAFMRDTFFDSRMKGLAFATVFLPITLLGAFWGIGKEIYARSEADVEITISPLSKLNTRPTLSGNNVKREPLPTTTLDFVSLILRFQLENWGVLAPPKAQSPVIEPSLGLPIIESTYKR